MFARPADPSLRGESRMLGVAGCSSRVRVAYRRGATCQPWREYIQCGAQDARASIRALPTAAKAAERPR
jgi:hypothetical protein